jgi:4-hydroxybenzoate polyprenyltransferase
LAAHSALWAYAKVCRLEYLRGEAPAVFVPALITVSSVQALLAPAVLEAIAVFAILYLAGFIVNALVDRELDVKYDSFKREIGEATARLGAGRVRAILAAHIAVALALALHLALTLAAPELFALAAVGTFLAMAYSLPPLHLKVRGVAPHAFSLALSAFAIPFLFLYRVAAGEIDAAGWGICAAFTITHYGLTYTNQAYDFDLDKREGVLTPPVRIGLRRSLRISAAVTAVGLVLLTVAVATLALSRATVASAWGAQGALLIAVGTPLLLFAGYGVPLRGVLRMLRAVDRAPSEVEAVPKMRDAVNYANFHAAGIASLAVFGLLFFAATVQAGGALDAQAADSLAFDEGAQVAPGGAPSTFVVSFSIRNGGALELPPGSVWAEVDWHEAGAARPAPAVRVPVASAVPAGATVPMSLVVAGGGPLPSGSTVGLRLLADANRDGMDIVTADEAVLQVP